MSIVELDVRSGLPAFTIVGPRRRRRARGARADPDGDPQQRLRVAAAADHRQPRPRRPAEGRTRTRPGARVRDPRRDRPGARRAAAEDRDVRRARRSTADVRPAQGTLAVADAARRGRLPALALAAPASHAAALVDGIEVAPLRSLRSAARLLRGGPADPAPPRFAAARGRRRRTAQSGPARRARARRRPRIQPRCPRAADRSRRRAQPAAERAARRRQDDARPAPARDPPAAGRCGGDRARPHRRRFASAGRARPTGGARSAPLITRRPRPACSAARAAAGPARP